MFARYMLNYKCLQQGSTFSKHAADAESNTQLLNMMIYIKYDICNFTFQDYISDLAEAMLNSDDDEFALECLGIMGNLTIPDLDYELILREYDLVPWIKEKLTPGKNNTILEQCFNL